jgi:acetoin utilization deacetylase AcuC-like enzyme
MKVALVYHPVYLEHDTGQHVENARRLVAVLAHLEETGLGRRLTSLEARAATPGELSLVHDHKYIDYIRDCGQRGGGWLDPDTVMSAGSYQAAVYAAGGALRASEMVFKGEIASAFVLARPPGHHATPGSAGGFCLFNNIAVATRYLLTEYRLERVLIVDFDVHHGNGTQAVFYDHPEVLYISTHQFPLYPGTGRVEETGNGAGKGANINLPLPGGSGDAEYLMAFEEVIVPAARRFKPQFILVSAGYDGHWLDPLASMRLSTGGYARLVRIISELAGELCGGRLVFTLEGGYHLEALSYSVAATLEVLLGSQDIEDVPGPSPRGSAPDISGLLQRVKEVHRLP